MVEVANNANTKSIPVKTKAVSTVFSVHAPLKDFIVVIYKLYPIMI